MNERDYGKDGAKLSHEAVGYKKGLPQAHCGICEHGHMSRPTERCDLVVDPIEPEDWCRKFERRK